MKIKQKTGQVSPREQIYISESSDPEDVNDSRYEAMNKKKQHYKE